LKTIAAACEFGIERKWRECRLSQIAPISTNLILAYIGRHVPACRGRISLRALDCFVRLGRQSQKRLFARKADVR
jgi:hypothetical protein